jgi:hypothetical protein
MIKVIFDISYTRYTDLQEERFIVYDKDGEFYYILDLSDKIKDVEKMPHYIKDDYYNHNTKILTIDFFNKIIEKYKVKYLLKSDILANSLEKEIRELSEEELNKIMTIKRELNLKEIL